MRRLLLALLLTGCTTLTEGPQKHSTVELVDPEAKQLLSGAECAVYLGTNRVVFQSGGSVLLPRQYASITINCYAEGKRASREVFPMPNYSEMVPVVGLVDAFSGNAVEFPDRITLALGHEIRGQSAKDMAACEGRYPGPSDTLRCLTP